MVSSNVLSLLSVSLIVLLPNVSNWRHKRDNNNSECPSSFSCFASFPFILESKSFQMRFTSPSLAAVSCNVESISSGRVYKLLFQSNLVI